MISFFYDSCFMFIRFLIPGIFLGLIYDIFRFMRIKRNRKFDSILKITKKRYFPEKAKNNENIAIRRQGSDNLLIFIEDVCFFLIVFIIEVLTIYHLNDGEIRIYCLLFSLIGFFCYQKTIGRLVIFISIKLLYLFRRIFCFFIFLILDPIVFIIKKFKKISSSLALKKMIKNKKECNKTI